MSEPIKRYALWQHAGCGHGGNYADLQPMPLGGWVKYADVAALEHRVNDLETNLFAATATVASLENRLAGVERERDDWRGIVKRQCAVERKIYDLLQEFDTSDSNGVEPLEEVVEKCKHSRDRLREALGEVEMELEGRYDGTLDSPTRWMGPLLLCIEQALKEG